MTNKIKYERDKDGELVLYLRDISNPDTPILQPIYADDIGIELYAFNPEIVIEVFPDDGENVAYTIPNQEQE